MSRKLNMIFVASKSNINLDSPNYVIIKIIFELLNFINLLIYIKIIHPYNKNIEMIHTNYSRYP